MRRQTINKVTNATEDKNPIRSDSSDSLNGPYFSKGPNKK